MAEVYPRRCAVYDANELARKSAGPRCAVPVGIDKMVLRYKDFIHPEDYGYEYECFF